MKKTTYAQYFELILKAKRNNPYFYVAIYNEAKRNLVPQQFMLLQQKISKAV